jgi:hypothetical protein
MADQTGTAGTAGAAGAARNVVEFVVILGLRAGGLSDAAILDVVL